jgi:hypothetical protein
MSVTYELWNINSIAYTRVFDILSSRWWKCMTKLRSFFVIESDRMMQFQMSTNEADEAISVVSFVSNYVGIYQWNSISKFEFLFNRISSVYLNVRLKALVSVILLSLIRFCINSALQFVSMEMSMICCKLCPPNSTNQWLFFTTTKVMSSNPVHGEV